MSKTSLHVLRPLKEGMARLKKLQQQQLAGGEKEASDRSLAIIEEFEEAARILSGEQPTDPK